MKNILFKVLFPITLLTSIANADEWKTRYLPAMEVKSEVSKNVQEFLDNQKQETVTRTVATKRDILGRAQNNVSVFQEQATTSAQKILVRVSYLEPLASSASNTYACSDNNNGVTTFSLNGDILAENIFFERIQEIETKKYNEAGFIANLTANEIKSLLQGERKVYIQDVTGNNSIVQAQANNLSSSTAIPYTSILDTSKITTLAHANGYNGSGVSAYLSENGCPKASHINTSYLVQHQNCTGITSSHATGMIQVFQAAAPRAILHEFSTNQDPINTSNETNYDIGIHSFTNNIIDTQYTSVEQYLDNYIFTSNTIIFIASGNQNRSSGNFDIESPGKALNAITVGAVTPFTNYYEPYSRWKNSEIKNQKPEIANYANFYFPSATSFVDDFGYTYNATQNGTSAATAYSAGMAAAMLQQKPFYKKHPEAFKSLMIAISSKQIHSARIFDADNFTVAATGLPIYPNFNSKVRSCYWNGSNSSFFNSNNQITFTETGIVAGKRYRIALAWLVSGNYVSMLKTIPQDIDLQVIQNGNVIASSISSRNPFEVVDFIAESSSNLTIKIERYANSGVGDVRLGYTLWRE